MSRRRPVVRRPARRRAELGMVLFAGLLTVGLWILAALGRRGSLPSGILPLLGVVLGLTLSAHVGVRLLAPRADPVLLPVAVLFNGIGYVFIARLDAPEASAQALWSMVGMVAFLATLLVVRRIRDLERFRYSFGLLGLVLLCLPLVPHFGEDIGGARLWFRVGPLSFQPGELAKLAFAVFFASVLAERADLLATPTRRLGRRLVLDPRYLAPVVGAWGLSLMILLAENDLGSSFLFFALFVGMLWMATGRGAYLGLGGVLFVGGAAFALEVMHHARSRVQAWLDPWPHFATTGYQIIEGWFGLANGGLWGLGPGRGTPQIIPEASTDFIFVSIAEELGLVGATALLVGFLVLVGTGLRIAIRAERPFDKLLAAGLALILGVQTFVIVGGVTRLIPLTGITLPFVSYGGSSLVSNYILLALLLRISDENNLAAERAAPAGPAAGRGLGTADPTEPGPPVNLSPVGPVSR